MKLLLLSASANPESGRRLARLSGVVVRRAPSPEDEKPDCVLLDSDHPPENWAEQVGGLPVLVLGAARGDHPWLPLAGLEDEAVFKAAVEWARRDHRQGAQTRDTQTRSRRILAQVTHELRSPITVISMANQLARKPGLERERLLENLDMIGESAEALQSLVNDILDQAKMEATVIELSESEFAVADFLQRICGSYRLLAQEKGVELVLQMPTTLPQRVVGDPGRLRQVLANLLGNAVKFTKRGTIKIEVESSKVDSARVELTFRVQDSGIGIAEAALGRIFEPYEQADESTFKQYGGTGLGLAICRQLVQRMGGDIGVQSTPGEGSVFTFRVRLGRVRPSLRAPRSAGLAGTPTLLVAKSQDDRQKYSALLKSWGAEVWSAGSRLDAFRLAPVADGGLVVMVLDGWDFELVRQIRQRRALQEAKFALLTAHGQRGDAALCQQLGVGAYLTLPLQDPALRRALELLQDGRSGLVTRYTVFEQAGAVGSDR